MKKTSWTCSTLNFYVDKAAGSEKVRHPAGQPLVPGREPLTLQ